MKTDKKTSPPHILCFSHLRWDFVYQRPQHILSQISKETTVYFLEEPVFDNTQSPYISFTKRSPGLWVGVPHFPPGMSSLEVVDTMAGLLDKFLANKNLEDFIFWYYTPMAMEFSEKHSPALTVYDCMDELSAFKFAPATIKQLEKKLMSKADVVFTGGHSLYEAKKNQHANIYPFPSSIDKNHFLKARTIPHEPGDQIGIKGPKIGFYGVIDERFDYELIGKIATKRPEWQLVMIGPVVKIDPSILPKNENIHYLGSKTYDELPSYLSGWDAALIPFLLNESTRYISPTKTPEYLSAGVPVVSTAIRDVVNPYGISRLVKIGADATEFIDAIEGFLKEDKNNRTWLNKADKFLSQNSWNKTVSDMKRIIYLSLQNKSKISIAS